MANVIQTQHPRKDSGRFVCDECLAKTRKSVIDLGQIVMDECVRKEGRYF